MELSKADLAKRMTDLCECLPVTCRILGAKQNIARWRARDLFAQVRLQAIINTGRVVANQPEPGRLDQDTLRVMVDNGKGSSVAFDVEFMR